MAGGRWEPDHALWQRSSNRAFGIGTGLDLRIAAVKRNIGDRAFGCNALDEREELRAQSVAARGGDGMEAVQRDHVFLASVRRLSA